MTRNLTSAQRTQLQANLRDVLRTNVAVKPTHPMRRNIKSSQTRRNNYASVKVEPTFQMRDQKETIKETANKTIDDFEHLKVLFKNIGYSNYQR